MKQRIALCWMRRDLRLHDHPALHGALTSGLPVLPVFLFDRSILDELANKRDRRVTFIHRQLSGLNDELRALGSGIWGVHAPAQAGWELILSALNQRGYEVESVHVNRDYEPYAQARDGAIQSFLESRGISYRSYRDHVIFEPDEVLKADGTPYTVFTPYSKRWLANAPEDRLEPVASEQHLKNCLHLADIPWPSLSEMGFEEANETEFPPINLEGQLLAAYGERRDLPAVAGTTRLSVHLRFGTVSVREAMRAGFEHSTKWLMELIWREFYQAIIHHFPHSAASAFKPAYDAVEWEPAGEEFEAWKAGKTGYPLVDAGMRELAATGFMHNRVRMVVASFLCKHLLLDWRLGERWFAEQLMDFELASNVGGWQWAAGTGCDAAPYFRVFNPTSQQEKFDPEWRYVRRWVPEFGTPGYPKPIVEHKFARLRAIDRYKRALKPDQEQPTLF
jgi:deoxyribodipyrimidine photo-lyase